MPVSDLHATTSWTRPLLLLLDWKEAEEEKWLLRVCKGDIQDRVFKSKVEWKKNRKWKKISKAQSKCVSTVDNLITHLQSCYPQVGIYSTGIKYLSQGCRVLENLETWWWGNAPFPQFFATICHLLLTWPLSRPLVNGPQWNGKQIPSVGTPEEGKRRLVPQGYKVRDLTMPTGAAIVREIMLM